MKNKFYVRDKKKTPIFSKLFYFSETVSALLTICQLICYY
jgi:hypothetical protein